MLYTLPVAENIQTKIEMHLHVRIANHRYHLVFCSEQQAPRPLRQMAT